MVLRAGWLVVAAKLQEAAGILSDNDKRSRLSDTLSDIFRGTGKWAYVVDIVGSDVIYSCDSDLYKAPYVATVEACTIDTAKAVEVFPITTYHEEQMEMGEAGARNSRKDLAHIQSIHDASMNLGAACKMSESAKPALTLVESAATLEPIALREARADYEIKLIAPGKGSSAYYPAEVLKRDGPNVFGAGTHVYLNHPTAAEEAARPEGDVTNLAGVLTTTAEYKESHPKGPGLYARMKVFADHAQMVEEKAPHVGMSIRASGIAESGKQKDGVPVLKQLTAATSVDVVTKAGAGGMILTEAARPAANPTQESTMDEAAVKKLVESAVADALKAVQQTTVAPLLERALRGDAREEAQRILKDVSLPDASKQRVIESALTNIPTKDGVLDVAAFATRVNEAAKAEGAYVAQLTGAGRVAGMGSAPVAPTAEEVAAREAAEKKLRESAVDSFTRIMGSKTAAEHAAKGRVN